ncbi:MAG TPA: PEP-CTERM sorting domain-containing protein [Candidatus Acidoferrales bacterium]|nr:PEP-CTERM sorting domain-containing protein [Candidatus Acidoferrales bacterium]
MSATTATPEPATFGFMLIGIGLLGLVMLRKRISLRHLQVM